MYGSRTREVLAALLAAIMLVLGLACGTEGDDGPNGDPEADFLKSDKLRITNPDVPQGELAELVAGNSAFAFDLYQELRGEEGNLFYSPFSISIALAMTFAGARTTTEQAMADTMHFTLGQDGVHPAFNLLDQELAGREEPANEYADDGFKLRIANSIWGQKGYPFVQLFLDTLAENYGAGLRLLDYGADPEACRLVINDWVEDKTEGKIEDLIPPGSITELTRLVLTNAIYFKAAWNEPFKEENTAPGEFTRADGSTATVEMMNQEAGLFYAAGDGYEAVELPYDGEQLSMVLVVPAAGEFDTFEAGLTAGRIDEILDAREYKIVTLGLPKFEYDFSVKLKDALKNMGMAEAFTFSSDFTGMTAAAEKVRISEVIHKAYVGVNEAGTEAAAATAVIMEGSGMPDHVTLTIDRPFLFLIRDVPTGTILFVGRVLDPTA